jgi:hypothetical protein
VSFVNNTANVERLSSVMLVGTLDAHLSEAP